MDTIIRTPQPHLLETNLQETYLRFQLEQHTPAILAVEYVQEVLIVPTRRLTPMPNMPKYMLGLLNRRNRVLWVIDLAKMLNLQAFDADTRQYNIAIVQVGQVSLGLVVHAVKDVTRFTRDRVQSVQGLVTTALAPYLHGCILQQKEIMLVLNAEAIVHSLALHSN